jgi:hypothetical protein
VTWFRQADLWRSLVWLRHKAGRPVAEIWLGYNMRRVDLCRGLVWIRHEAGRPVRVWFEF